MTTVLLQPAVRPGVDRNRPAILRPPPRPAAVPGPAPNVPLEAVSIASTQPCGSRCTRLHHPILRCSPAATPSDRGGDRRTDARRRRRSPGGERGGSPVGALGHHLHPPGQRWRRHSHRRPGPARLRTADERRVSCRRPAGLPADRHHALVDHRRAPRDHRAHPALAHRSSGTSSSSRRAHGSPMAPCSAPRSATASRRAPPRESPRSRSIGTRTGAGSNWAALDHAVAPDPTLVPADTAEGASASTTISIGFSSTMDRADVERSFLISPHVAGELSWGGSTLTFAPAQRLEPGTRYSVALIGAHDADGDQLAGDVSFSFTIGSPPRSFVSHRAMARRASRPGRCRSGSVPPSTQRRRRAPSDSSTRT